MQVNMRPQVLRQKIRHSEAILHLILEVHKERGHVKYIMLLHQKMKRFIGKIQQ